MEFQEFWKQKKRMCQSIKQCNDCPIGKSGDEFCACSIELYPQKVEEIVRKWAEKHPAKTNKDKFNEVFGRNFVQKDKACTHICGQALPCTDCDWWKMEYKEPEKGE